MSSNLYYTNKYRCNHDDGLFYFILHSTSISGLKKCCPLRGYAVIQIATVNHQCNCCDRSYEYPIINQSYPFQIGLNSICEDGYCGEIGSFLDLAIHEDKIRLVNTIHVYFQLYTTREDLDTNSIKIDEPNASSIENDDCSLSSDLERIRVDEDFSDVTISVKGKNYPAHKLILAARSSVFKAMFKNDMQESQTNHITITDMEQEIFEEMLQYIYTGKMPNLHEWAFELLPAADKYDLEGLKNACERLLLTKISAENACKILVLADMHNAEELKAHALRFIKENPANFETEIWNVLTESRPGLMKDMLAMFLKK
ncbi:speckle-type POZ protein-like [Planococcus citri]|uniref:speckle-type POZ protein-like n=1 Tax=Planococcus citri TaxID=170843 RepID=UPI0031F74F1F